MGSMHGPMGGNGGITAIRASRKDGCCIQLAAKDRLRGFIHLHVLMRTRGALERDGRPQTRQCCCPRVRDDAGLSGAGRLLDSDALADAADQHVLTLYAREKSRPKLPER
jgi:hypothetical protein